MGESVNIFESLKNRIIPPLWMWVRLCLLVSCSLFLLLFGFSSTAEIVATISIIQILAYSLAIVCQEFSNVLKSKISKKDR